MASKQYKNVYTILEKVKKGEIKSYYNDDEGLFGKINFYKKPDIIKPHMHYIDESRIDNIMSSYMRDENNLKSAFAKFASSSDYAKKIPDSKKPDIKSFHNKLLENFNKFPKHMVKDIFKMFYYKMDKLEFEERTDKNYTKYKFLEKANNPVGKIMTEGSNLKSAIFARNIIGYYLTRMTMMDYVDEQASNDIKNSLSGGSDFDNSGVDEALDKMMNSTQGKNMLEKAMNDAQELCKEMDDAMGDEIQEKMFENSNQGGGDGTAGKLSPDYIRTIAAKLEKVKISMTSLKDKLKKLLDKSVSYFSSNTDTIYEDLFNSDNIAGLEDYELLHPKLRKIFAEDLQVKDTKSVGKIDIYIDISGSMSSDSGVKNDENHYISRIDFCKSMVAKLAQMDMLNEVYTFDNYVKKYKTDPVSIAMLDCGGGTTINRAIESINRNGVNAIILTDAEDGCSIYSDKAFFIGLKGCNFSHFESSTIEEYANKDQVVIFDGNKISKIDSRGHMIKA